MRLFRILWPFFDFWRKRVEKCFPGLSKSLTPSVDFRLSHSRSQKMHKFGQHVLLAAESAFWFFSRNKNRTQKQDMAWNVFWKGSEQLDRIAWTMSPCQQDTINQFLGSDLCYYVMEAEVSTLIMIKVVCIRLRRTTEQITDFFMT